MTYLVLKCVGSVRIHLSHPHSPPAQIMMALWLFNYCMCRMTWSVFWVSRISCVALDFAGADGSSLIVCAEWCIQRSGHAGAVRHAGTVALYASARQHQLWLSTTATPGSLTAPSPSPRGFTSTVWLVHSVWVCEWKRMCVCVCACIGTHVCVCRYVCVREREKREHVCVLAHLCRYVCVCVSHPVWFVHCVCWSVSLSSFSFSSLCCRRKVMLSAPDVVLISYLCTFVLYCLTDELSVALCFWVMDVAYHQVRLDQVKHHHWWLCYELSLSLSWVHCI